MGTRDADKRRVGVSATDSAFSTGKIGMRKAGAASVSNFAG